MSDLPMRMAADLQHRVIEQAKASYKREGCDMTFEGCLAFHAERMVPAEQDMHWLIGERNGVWTLDVWWEPADGPDEGSTSAPWPPTKFDEDAF